MPMTTKLYAFGSNGSGQLGVGHHEDLSKPKICVFQPEDETGQSAGDVTILNDKIVKLVAGGNHTLVLTESGQVWASGDNVGGRCDPLSSFGGGCVFKPVKMARRLGRVSDIAAMWDRSVLVVDDTKVYTFGSVAEASSGVGGDHVKTDTLLEPVFDLADHVSNNASCRIVAISSGMQHVLVLLSNGNVYGWGACRKGQLGNTPGNVRFVSESSEAIKIQIPFKVAHAVAGRDYTFLRSTEGDCQLLGDKRHFVELSKFEVHPCDTLQSGWSTLCSLKDGRLRGIGRGSRGQLPPEDLPILKAFAAGSEHVVAQTQDDKILAWGWGEHGNCGQPLDQRGNVSGRYNTIETELDLHEKLAGIGAGCATSFFWTSFGT